MSQFATTYIAEVSEKFKTGRAGEHAYRPTFEKFIKAIDKTVGVVNDPKRTEYGAPDFIFVRGDLIAGYAETKDMDVDLDKTIKTEQMERYFGYSNLILTNYLEFRFFRNGQLYGEPITIGKIDGDTVKIIDESITTLENVIKDFLIAQPEAIKSGVRLAKIMGGKARRIRDNVKQFLVKESDENKELTKIYSTIQQLLVHDLDSDSFADMYAQTLVYGLFVARYHDDSPKDFSRREAGDLIPASNPFLRHFFDHIAGINFDQRLAYIVNELCEIFRVADVQKLMSEYYEKNLFGEEIKGPDPVIHFYEDFLKEYDPALRKKMGAYYTPLPVVRFIIKAVDDILQKSFKLTDGLADTSKLSNGLHRVQVLDPAVGTGTFISAVIRKIYELFVKTKQDGRWPTYVHHDLLPRIYGFELMMASYTIAHLKLSIEFSKTKFKYFNKRLGIYLTNSLEEVVAQDALFSEFGLAQSITEEAKEAAVIKSERPIMVVVGNPPYSGESSNAFYTGHDVYKTEPTGGKLKERNSKWLNDDYVKFIRLAESMIEKTGEGIVAMITAHGYIDNPTFRGMRFHLMKTFNEIYVLDLHGNANKKERAPDGRDDKNIFDIKTGVAIFIGIKNKNSKETVARVFRADCFGSRPYKFKFLNDNTFASIEWMNIVPSAPNYEWVIRDIKTQGVYQTGFSVSELFLKSSVGIVTARDGMSIQFTKSEIEEIIRNFQNLDEETLRNKYDLGKDVQDWKVAWAKKDILENFDSNKIMPISYRPFDVRWTCYTGTSRGFHVRPRSEVMTHMTKDNLALIILRQVKAGKNFQHVFVSKNIIESTLISNKTSEIDYVLPFYIYDHGDKLLNLNKGIIINFEKVTGKVSPEDIFDYIYAVLYSPSYREKFREFLKIDFPRVPYPKNKEIFKKLISLGQELRLLHLFESPKLNKLITSYSEDGSNLVEKINYKDGNVFINDKQYFGGVPEVAWNFWIGGYQPAQKWLKDRKSRVLTNEEIEHYQKMIVALVETEKIIKEIDKIDFL